MPSTMFRFLTSCMAVWHTKLNMFIYFQKERKTMSLAWHHAVLLAVCLRLPRTSLASDHHQPLPLYDFISDSNPPWLPTSRASSLVSDSPLFPISLPSLQACSGQSPSWVSTRDTWGLKCTPTEYTKRDPIAASAPIPVAEVEVSKTCL